jgi:geranylgeranyl pyrophosphate synthase
MTSQSSRQVCLDILEKHGGPIADRARSILLEDPKLHELNEQLEFMKNNWRDLTPALMSLSCEAVGGNPEETYDAALAISLSNYCFTVWDDLIDNAKNKLFTPTVYGRFGQAQTIIIGGLSAAKAFTLLNQANYSDTIKNKIIQSTWALWCKIAVTETFTLESREQGTITSKQKFEKIESEVINIGTVLKIGAIIGKGSSEEIDHLEKYGRHLGVILALKQDFEIALNLTIELEEKIKNNRLPYTILWAKEHSVFLKNELELLRQKTSINPTDIQQFVRHLLDTQVPSHIQNFINTYNKKAEEELSYLNTNSATLSLKSLVALQPEIFMELI